MLRVASCLCFGLAAVLAAPLAAQRDSAGRASKPNILLILSDDMGYGDLGCYGSTQIETPAIDALARGGVRMTQAYVTAPVCAPSRAGLITGRMQNRFGFEHNLSTPDFLNKEHAGLPLDEKTMADRLRALGYRTGLIGKWHLGESVEEQHPTRRGFDEFFGMLKGSHGYWPKPGKHKLERNGKPVQEIRTPYLTDWFTLEAIDFIKADDAKPWFLFLSFNTPHTPMQAKPGDLEVFAEVEPKRRRIYCAMQRCMDRNIATLVASLRASGQLDDTLIVFTNDNGGSVDASSALNAPLRGQKSTMLEGGLRVPMIAHWPKALPKGKVYSQPVSLADLCATFVAAAGGRIVPEVIGRGRRRSKRVYDGVDLLPFWRGERAAKRPHERLFWRLAHRGAAIREGDYKLIRLPHSPPMLFELSSDPSEQSDLAATDVQRVRAMMRTLHDWECSLEREPKWTSGPFWARYNRRLYERKYSLSQPGK